MRYNQSDELSSKEYIFSDEGRNVLAHKNIRTTPPPTHTAPKIMRGSALIHL
jgi:hypothetical protein